MIYLLLILIIWVLAFLLRRELAGREWHTWHAWYPVKTTDGGIAWFEDVERRSVATQPSVLFRSFEYRKL